MINSNGSSTRECAGVERLAEANLPTEVGVFRIVAFKSRLDGEEFPVLVKGELDAETPTLVRIHSQCLTGDVFQSLKCDCGKQLEQAMKRIQEEGRGVIVYQQQEGCHSDSKPTFANMSAVLTYSNNWACAGCG